MSTSLLTAPTVGGGGQPARPARRRLSEPMPADRLLGWLGPLAVALVAGVLRFWRLDEPRLFVFDETYYAKDAFSLLRFGYERGFVEDANARILAGDLDVFTDAPAFIAHPPLGKWVIALGEAAFGVTPLGWRVPVAVAGTLSVLMLARIGRRLFRSTLLGCTAGLLLALDGLHLVHSRTALLDLIVMMFALGGFGALLVDRDRTRARLAAGLGRGVRPWRWLAGALLGAACATKWNGVFYIAAFGLLTVAWDYGARRATTAPGSTGARRPAYATLLRDAPAALAAVVGAAALTYLASWAGWLRADDSYGRGWAVDNPSPLPVPDALRSLWHYHAEIWDFNRNLEAFHPYAAHPWSWPIVGRPVSFAYESPKLGEAGCPVETCAQAVTAIGTPPLWWAGVFAVLACVVLWAGRRDWRAGAVLAGVAAGYLPWFVFAERTIYFFYAVVYLPWLVLAVTLCLGLLLGPPTASPARRVAGAAGWGGFMLLVVGWFAWLYPILTAQTIPVVEWSARMSVFPSWV